MPNKKSFTFHIAKKSGKDLRDYLSENAKINLASPTSQSLGVKDFGERAALFVFRGHPSTPRWLKQLARAFNGLDEFSTFSGAAVLLLEISGRVLAVTFSHGWMYLDQKQFEADFGIKVAVNALDVGKLRRLDKSNLGDALQGVSQSPFQREFRSLWTSDALDIVSRLSGKTREDVSSDAMTGSKSLKITGEYEIKDIPEIATELISHYEAEEYKNTDFAIIDFVRPILDREEISQLDKLAAESIAEDRQDFELSLPLDVSSDALAFKFKGTGMRITYPDLMLNHYQRSLGKKLTDLSPQSLKTHKVIALFGDARPPLDMSIKDALVGTVEMNAKRYAANEGNWFRIDDTFRQAMETRFVELKANWTDTDPPLIRFKYDAKKNGRLESEDDYNSRLAEHYDFALLDKKEIVIPNAPRSGFEPCDLLDVTGKRFIHVKKSSRRSAVLSHFFKQGSNSARQFSGVPSCWSQLAKCLTDLGREQDAMKISDKDYRNGWTVEYWIVDHPRDNGEFNIPFFSKISLHDEAQDTQSRQFDVALKFIRRPKVEL